MNNALMTWQRRRPGPSPLARQQKRLGGRQDAGSSFDARTASFAVCNVEWRSDEARSEHVCSLRAALSRRSCAVPTRDTASASGDHSLDMAAVVALKRLA
eukprot:2542744-Pleurochrysis_carterae.AAC.1